MQGAYTYCCLSLRLFCWLVMSISAAARKTAPTMRAEMPRWPVSSVRKAVKPTARTARAMSRRVATTSVVSSWRSKSARAEEMLLRKISVPNLR